MKFFFLIIILCTRARYLFSYIVIPPNRVFVNRRKKNYGFVFGRSETVMIAFGKL